MPSSAALFNKQLQLLNFCESLWPTKTTSLKCQKERAESENPGMFMLPLHSVLWFITDLIV